MSWLLDLAARVRLVISLAWLYLQVVATTIWEDERARLLVLLSLTVAIAIWRAALGRLSLDDIVNELLLGAISSLLRRLVRQV
jgi:hypothetical protein